MTAPRMILGRAELRVMMLAAMFAAGFVAVAARMSAVALTPPAEPRLEAAIPAHAQRGEITDRNGRILATTIPAWAVYAHPHEMIDRDRAARLLAQTLEGVKVETLRKAFAPGRKFAWVKRPIGPREMQAAHDLGLPGIYFGAREARLYPAGRIAAHVLGGVRSGREWTSYAELVGRAGVERGYDDRLAARDGVAPARLRLSLDLPAQAALTQELRRGMARFGAIGAASVLMEADTGRVLALVSLPDFDPNRRPAPNDPRVAATRALTNRAAEAVFELGSTFKPFYAALAMELGIAGPNSVIDTSSPYSGHGARIRDSHRLPERLSLTDVIVESSNTGVARLADRMGGEAVRRFLRQLGFFEPTALELPEARLGRPILPKPWRPISTVTIGYGHGLAATPVHLAAAYAALVNGGLKVRPTLDPDAPQATEEDRVISARSSAHIRDMLAGVVARGTGRKARVAGYQVGGKTGTAEKPSNGGYDRERVYAVFAAAFPISQPRYVLVTLLDEAENTEGPKPVRSAGATAGLVSQAAISRLGPLLGLRPHTPDAPQEPKAISLASGN